VSVEKKDTKKMYLDHNATTKVDPIVLDEMLPYLRDIFGNPSSIHLFGQDAKSGIELARRRIAVEISASQDEIYFTSGGTESNNLAIKGVVYSLKAKGNHIITSKVEHLSVLEVCKALEREGFRVTYLDVDEYGMVKPEDVLSAINPSTILITIMYANNEVGTIQPIKEISEIAKDKGIYLHSDAVQALGKIKLDVEDLQVDLLSISAHKIYGPKGVGALYIRKGTRIKRITDGGHHERDLRPGTENVAGIVGFGKATESVCNDLRFEGIKRLRDRLQNGIIDNIKDVKINGHPKMRLPNTLNISIKGVEGEMVLLQLNLKGIACSAGSACTSASSHPSHVLSAMNVPREFIQGSLRFSLGKENTQEEIDYTIDTLVEIVSRIRSISPKY